MPIHQKAQLFIVTFHPLYKSDLDNANHLTLSLFKVQSCTRVLSYEVLYKQRNNLNPQKSTPPPEETCTTTCKSISIPQDKLVQGSTGERGGSNNEAPALRWRDVLPRTPHKEPRGENTRTHWHFFNQDSPTKPLKQPYQTSKQKHKAHTKFKQCLCSLCAWSSASDLI